MSGKHRSSSPGTRHGFRVQPAVLKRLVSRATLLGAALIVLTLFGAAVATGAAAYWQSTGTGSGSVGVGTLAPPTNVSVPDTSTATFAVTWNASAGAVTPTGYYVTRTTGATTHAACGSSPTTLIAGTSCTVTAVPDGSHTFTVTAVYRSWTANSRASAEVLVSTPKNVVFTAQPPASVTAGATISAVAVQLRNASGAAVTTAGIAVTLDLGSNPGAGTLSGTTTVYTDRSGTATFSGLSINKAGSGYTFRATSSGVTPATSSAFTISAAAASKLVFTTAALSGAATDAATIGPFTVQRQDAYGNPVTAGGSLNVNLGSTSHGTAKFSATSGGAAITAATIATGHSSVSVFFGDTKAGSTTIGVGATGLSSATQTATITAGEAHSLAFGQQPTNTVQRIKISPAPTVLVFDRFDNQRTTEESGRWVTMSLTHCASNFLRGNTEVATNHGIATFVKIGSNETATHCRLIASSTGLVSATSNAFDVTAGEAPPGDTL